MPLQTGQWADAINQLQSENFFGGVVLFHNGNSAANYNELIIRNDATGDNLKPLEATLETAYTNFLAAQNVANSEATQAESARNALKALMNGLHGLSASDKGYALYCRLLASRDGASNATINGIVDRPTAVAYVTSKPEWTAATAATRNLIADILEADAALCMVLLLVL
jgi:hypothetical protein